VTEKNGKIKMLTFPFFF